MVSEHICQKITRLVSFSKEPSPAEICGEELDDDGNCPIHEEDNGH